MQINDRNCFQITTTTTTSTEHNDAFETNALQQRFEIDTCEKGVRIHFFGAI